MKNDIKSLTKDYSFKIVIRYAIISIIYSYSINYLLKIAIPNSELCVTIEKEEDLLFIIFTSLFLYLVVKKNIREIHSNYKQIFELKDKTDAEYINLFYC